MFVRVLGVFLCLSVGQLAAFPAFGNGILPDAGQSDEAGDPPKFLMLTEQNPPFNYSNHETGAIVGASVELVHEMMRRAGFAYDIRIMPWRRAFAQAQGDANVCLFSMNYTEERAPLFKWVKPLYGGGGLAFYARADDPRQYETDADIKGNVLLSRTAEATSKRLEDFPNITIVKVDSDMDGFNLLARGRGDLLMSGLLMSKTLLARTGREEEFRVAYVLQEASVAIGCSLKTSDELIDRLIAANESLETVRHNVLARYWQQDQ